MYAFQRSGDGLDDIWIVSTSAAPFKGVLGTLSFSGRLVDTRFDVWPQRHFDWVAKAKRLLQSSEMWDAFVPAREAYLKKEQETGPLRVVIGGTECSRWHTYRRASDYAEERLQAIWLRGVRVTRRAEISRDTGGVFDALEVSEFGHLKKARLVA